MQDSGSLTEKLKLESQNVTKPGAEAVDADIEGHCEEVLVDGGYGWICVLAVALINAHTWGIVTVRPQILS